MNITQSRHRIHSIIAVAAVSVTWGSLLGIGGGLLGNQVGSGDGKTLATIAGAVGGGYLCNEVAKRNQ